MIQKEYALDQMTCIITNTLFITSPTSNDTKDYCFTAVFPQIPEKIFYTQLPIPTPHKRQEPTKENKDRENDSFILNESTNSTCAEFLNFAIAGLEAVIDPCQNVMATEIVCCGACTVHINCHLLI